MMKFVPKKMFTDEEQKEICEKARLKAIETENAAVGLDYLTDIFAKLSWEARSTISYYIPVSDSLLLVAIMYEYYQSTIYKCYCELRVQYDREHIEMGIENVVRTHERASKYLKNHILFIKENILRRAKFLNYLHSVGKTEAEYLYEFLGKCYRLEGKAYNHIINTETPENTGDEYMDKVRYMNMVFYMTEEFINAEYVYNCPQL